MPISVKQMVKSTSVWNKVLKPIRSASEIRSWQLNERPVPPPHSIKARNILCLADLFGIDVLIETGTFRGDMIAATKDRFKQIIDALKEALPYRGQALFFPIRLALAGAIGKGALDRVTLLLDSAAKLPFREPVKDARHRILEFCAALD